MKLDSSELTAVKEALARMRLLQADGQAAITPLAGGVSSLIARVDTNRRALCVKIALPRLKVAAVWEAPVERNRAEVAWMKAAGKIVPGMVPRILGEDAQGNAFAMEFLEPSDHPVWKSQLLAGQADVATARAVARGLIAIHTATADDENCAAAFANDANFYALRLDPYFVATARKHPECAAQLLQRLVTETAGTKRALVHGDVSPKNILVGPSGPILLDAECAWYGDPAFDLAFCLNHLLLKSVARPDMLDDCIECFDALASVYLAGVNWEPAAAFESRCAALLGGLLLARIDGKSPVEYIQSETDRDRVRAVAIPLVSTPVDRLSLIVQRWKPSK